METKLQCSKVSRLTYILLGYLTRGAAKTQQMPPSPTLNETQDAFVCLDGCSLCGLCEMCRVCEWCVMGGV